MYKKLIFVCSPYRPTSTDPKIAKYQLDYNIQVAKSVCKSIAQSGNIPYAPHLFAPHFLNDDDSKEREMGINIGLYMLEKADVVFVVGNRISEGMKAEIDYAEKHNKKIRYMPEYVL